MKTRVYKPSPGSTAEKAIAALQNGSLTVEQLCAAIGTTPGMLKYQIRACTKHGLIVRVHDTAGIEHFVLGSMPLDERFTRCDVQPGSKVLEDAPQAKRVTKPSIQPTREAIAAANLFWPTKAGTGTSA